MNYEIKSATEASVREIFFDKNTNKLSFKNDYGIITIINPDVLTTSSNTVVVTMVDNKTTYSDGRPDVNSGILTMGTSAIELLPTPGANKYYDYERLILEFEPGTVPYATSVDLSFSGGPFPTMSGQIYKAFKNVNIAYAGVTYVNTTTGNAFSPPAKLNQSLLLSTLDAVNPTDGDGTLRAIITYTERTFGVW